MIQIQRMAEMTTKSKWEGDDGMKEFIINQTQCKPYSGAGICPRVKQKTTILRSVDNTYYYADNLNDVRNVKYTLFGHYGDQERTEKKFNKPLLDFEKSENIYLYRVNPTAKNGKYTWYGKYKCTGEETVLHPDKDRKMRNIIVLNLTKVDV